MLKKARQGKHGSQPTIFSRWYDQEENRKSLAEHNIGEKEVMLLDRIALESRDYTATRAERLQNGKHWIIRLNADGPKSLFDSDQNLPLLKKMPSNARRSHGGTQQSLRPMRPEHKQRQRQNQQFEGGENFDYYVDRKTGWRYCR